MLYSGANMGRSIPLLLLLLAPAACALEREGLGRVIRSGDASDEGDASEDRDGGTDGQVLDLDALVTEAAPPPWGSPAGEMLGEPAENSVGQ
jgi:hypothetical protein